MATRNVSDRWEPRVEQGWLKRAAPPAITIAFMLLAWEFSVQTGGISQRTLASPTQIAQSMISTWQALMDATAVTTYEAVLGFAIAFLTGLLLGIGLYWSKTLHRALYPLLVASQTIPLIAIAPLFMIWFGFEPTGKIMVVAIFAVFPIVLQTTRGLTAVPEFYEDVALTCGATRAWTLWHVKLRVAAHQIFGGVRISSTYVFGTAVTAEYLGASNGLGIWLQAAFNSFSTPPIFSATIIIVVLTGVLLAIVGVCEHLIVGQDDIMNNSMAEQ